MLSSPFHNFQDMKEFDSESNSDEDRTTHTFRSYTVQEESLPFNFVPVIKPKKSCQTIIHLNLLDFLDEIEQKKYFSDGEVNQTHNAKHKVVNKRKEHSVINDSLSKKTQNMLLQDNDSQHNLFYVCSTTKSQSGQHLIKERSTIYLSLLKRKKMKDN